MAQGGHIYVLAFDSGTLKVGRASNPDVRIATHEREAARHGHKLIERWTSPPHTNWQKNEQKLIRYCAHLGQRIEGEEYFRGVDFERARAYAEALVDGYVPAREAGPPAFGDVWEVAPGIEPSKLVMVISPGEISLLGRIGVVPVLPIGPEHSTHPLSMERLPGLGAAVFARFTTIESTWLVGEKPVGYLDPDRHADVARRIRSFIGPE